MTQPSSGTPRRNDYLFVRRPVLAIVISIAITLLGLFALRSLPVNRYPNITPPGVQVTAVYPGATAQDVATSVAAPIEQQLNGLEGLLYYRSSNSSNGVMSLQLTFDISRNQDLAAVDVQNAINLALPQLPASVRQNGVTITKSNPNALFFGALQSDDPRYDAGYLANYGKLYVENELKRLPGVGNAQFFSSLEFSMLISLDPDKMAQLGITVDDVSAAVQQANATRPAGRLGREPAPPGTELTLNVTTRGRLSTPEEFGAIVVRARPDGSIVHLRDIASIRLGGQGYDLATRINGKETAVFAVYSRPGANDLAVKKAVDQRMNELASSFPPGVSWAAPFDTTPFITESIIEVAKTLGEAMLLVTLVVFVFLQSWRATLIPLLAVPVSIIGTFLGLQALGFSVNTLTLFGMVLAIGIVVDDAIVVIENTERIMAQEHLPPREATNRAMRQIAGALIAIVLVLCSVFVPVAFMGGITGSLYQQFAATIVIAVVLSGIVALTLTPALCSLLLQHAPEETDNRLAHWFNDRFALATNRYIGAARRIIGRPRAWFAIFAVMLVLIVVLFKRVPGSFIPSEDKGVFLVSVHLPDAASLQRTTEVVKQVEQILMSEPATRSVVSLVGLDILAGSNQTNGATIFASLKPWGERKDKKDQVDAILQRVNGRMFGLKDAMAFGFNLPEISGLGFTAGLEINLQDRTGADLRDFARSVGAFVQDASKFPSLATVSGGIRTDVPEVYVTVDEDAARSRGVQPEEIFSTLQAMLSTLYINDFNLYGRTYRVQAQAKPEFRLSPADIGRYYVRGDRGDMVPLSALVQTSIRGAPNVLTRFNGFPSAMISASVAPGHSSGEALRAVEQLISTKYASQGVGYAYSGQSYQEKVSQGAAGVVIVLGLVMMFLVLAAQYESWSIPFAVMFGLPFGVFGALLAVWLTGMSNDVYFQIGLIAVIGLAAKNAILIVEFASELRRQGRTVVEAAVEAARERFRPILMTSFAFILGVSPLLTASGAGALSRHSLGVSVVFGMLGATVIGVFFIPLFFVGIRRISEHAWFRHKAAPAADHSEEG
jgi:hydrophobe/amphiphile efflux-1 (HAE1) family protein